jgi:hypothetical protein
MLMLCNYARMLHAGNLGLCYLRMAKLSNEPQVQEEGYRLAEVYFRESEAQNDDSLYNLASLYALRGRTGICLSPSPSRPPHPPNLPCVVSCVVCRVSCVSCVRSRSGV